MTRRFIWLAVAIVAVIALYTGGWLYAADRLVSEANGALARLSSGGDRATCEDMEARGYPFRIGLFCSSVFFERRIEGVSFDGEAFRSVAQIYAPLRVLAELDSPARVNVPGLLPLHLEWKTLRASSRLARPLPDRLSLVAAGFKADVDTPGAGTTGLFNADELQLHLRPTGADLDIGVRFAAAAAGPYLTELSFPPVSGVGDIKLADGVLRIEKRDFALLGTSLEIRQLEISIEGGGTLAVSGPLEIGDDGLIDADLQIRASDAKALLAILADSFPEIRTEMLTLGAGLAALGPGQVLPLRIRDGVVTLAFIELGRIPPV
jgi:hypothetical protein